MNLPIKTKQIVTEGSEADSVLNDAVQNAMVFRRKLALPLFLRQKRLWCALLLPLAYLLSQAAVRFPGVTEAGYSRGIYPVLSSLFGFFSSLVPRSVSELMLFALPLLLLVWIGRSVQRLGQSPRERKNLLMRMIAPRVCIGACTVFAFTAFGGLN